MRCRFQSPISACAEGVSTARLGTAPSGILPLELTKFELQGLGLGSTIQVQVQGLDSGFQCEVVSVETLGLLGVRI